MARKISADSIIAALRKLEQKSNVAGYVVMKGATHIGTVRFSYPRDGAGKLQGFAADMTRNPPEGCDFRNWTRWQYGWANGGGYDKHTAALGGMTLGKVTFADQGYDWIHQLREAGYVVIQAV